MVLDSSSAALNSFHEPSPIGRRLRLLGFQKIAVLIRLIDWEAQFARRDPQDKVRERASLALQLRCFTSLIPLQSIVSQTAENRDMIRIPIKIRPRARSVACLVIEAYLRPLAGSSLRCCGTAWPCQHPPYPNLIGRSRDGS